MSALNPEKLSPQTSSLKDLHSKQLPPFRRKRPILPFWRAIWDDFVPYRPSGDQKCFPPSCDFVPYCPSRRALWDEIVPYCPPEGQYGTNLARGGQYGTDSRRPMVPSLTTNVIGTKGGQIFPIIANLMTLNISDDHLSIYSFTHAHPFTLDSVLVLRYYLTVEP